MITSQYDPTPAYDMHGKITPMARSGGYVMVKRPRCAPFILSEKDWRKLPKTQAEGCQWTAQTGRVVRIES